LAKRLSPPAPSLLAAALSLQARERIMGQSLLATFGAGPDSPLTKVPHSPHLPLGFFDEFLPEAEIGRTMTPTGAG